MSENYTVKDGKLKVAIPHEVEFDLDELEAAKTAAEEKLATVTAKIQKEIDVYTARIAAAKAGGLKTSKAIPK